MVPPANDSILKQLKRNKFLDSYFPCQNWSFQDSVIYYITMNPSSPKVYQKMIQSCKYFFVRNPIIVVDSLSYNGTKISAVNIVNENVVFKKIENVTRNLWISDTLFFGGKEQLNPNAVLSFIPRLYRYKIASLSLLGNISYKDFLLISSKFAEINLESVIVKNEDDTIVPLEKLVKALPKVKKFFISDSPIESSFTLNTVKELLEIPHFSKINKFELCNIPEIFDIETFYNYIKKNKYTKLNLEFAYNVSEVYRNRLETIIDEILETDNHDFYPPLIDFRALDYQKWGKLRSLHHKN